MSQQPTRRSLIFAAPLAASLFSAATTASAQTAKTIISPEAQILWDIAKKSKDDYFAISTAADAVLQFNDAYSRIHQEFPDNAALIKEFGTNPDDFIYQRVIESGKKLKSEIQYKQKELAELTKNTENLPSPRQTIRLEIAASQLKDDIAFNLGKIDYYSDISANHPKADILKAIGFRAGEFEDLLNKFPQDFSEELGTYEEDPAHPIITVEPQVSPVI